MKPVGIVAPDFVRDWRPLEMFAPCRRPSYPVVADERADRSRVADPDDPALVRRNGRKAPIIALPERERCCPLKGYTRASAHMLLERGEIDSIGDVAMAKPAANEPDPDDIAREEMRGGA